MRRAVRHAQVSVLRFVLAALGALMAVASLCVPRLRRQITRDMTVEVSSDDGACQRYRLHARTRTIRLQRSGTGAVTCALRFRTGGRALVTLLSPRRVGRIVDGMNDGSIRIDGNPVLILYFHGLTRVVAPIGRSRQPRRIPPIELRTPERQAPWAARIVREPAVDELSREWPAAWAAREKLLQLRGPDLDPLPPG